MRQLRPELRRLSADRSGSIAIVFALGLMVVLFALGLALDTGRALDASSIVTSALDSASLAAARSMGDDDRSAGEAGEIALTIFKAHMEDHESLKWSHFTTDIDKPSGRVGISVDIEVPTTFTRVLGRRSISMNRTATAVYKIKDLEIALVLDVTGSMNDEDKIGSLKQAAGDLIDIVLEDDFSPHTRIALAPYSAAVNIGSYAAAASDGVSVDDCVYERINPGHAYTDTAPGPGKYFHAASDPSGAPPANIDPIGSPTPYTCPDAVLLPLSNNRTLLKSTIDSFNANGWTAGHLGAAWGWYLVSPEWDGFWPAASRPKAYGAPNLTKAVILMTDGIFNTAYDHDPSSVAAGKLCEEMKAEGITIYSVAFKAPADAEATLLACATSPAHFFSADDGDALRSAFKSIGGALSALRISK